MTYDVAREVVAMYGGKGPSSIFNDTWEWDGQSWTNRNLGLD